jgi:hypothetical protein
MCFLSVLVFFMLIPVMCKGLDFIADTYGIYAVIIPVALVVAFLLYLLISFGYDCGGEACSIFEYMEIDSE